VASQVGEISWHVAGDIGGTGVSRFRFISSSGTIVQADVNAAAAATRSLLNSMVAYYPNAIAWTCQPQVDVYDVSTGLVQVPWSITAIPAGIVGTGGASWSAGTGGRINWRTSVVNGRRLMRGATFLVPFSTAAFGTTGAVAGGTVAACQAGIVSYLNAIAAANLLAAVWHRPPKGTFAGGVTGPIFAGSLSTTPSSLRSRRT
jgi:hypothetical protein